MKEKTNVSTMGISYNVQLVDAKGKIIYDKNKEESKTIVMKLLNNITKKFKDITKT